MVTVVSDARLEERLQAERRASGGDRFDEVWEGTYMMNPMPNNEHQQLVMGISAALYDLVCRDNTGDVLPGANVSDRTSDWEHNYRIPDIAVFLKSGTAKNCGAFWHGGPDLAIEIVSPGESSREKIPFYGAVQTGELLIVDRDPWSLELLRLETGQMRCVGRATVGGDWLESAVLPVKVRLVAGKSRPQVEVVCQDDPRAWIV
ncbi:MAG: Uma2 family endonuclease [Planctomycetales bacterium]|nr:Uma2 family endonuclease [Planctomycetales bacterium]